MQAFNKLNKFLFTVALVVMAIVGLVVVGSQVVGLFRGDGGLMVWADKEVYPTAVLGSTFAAFLSFIYPYTKSKQDRAQQDNSL